MIFKHILTHLPLCLIDLIVETYLGLRCPNDGRLMPPIDIVPHPRCPHIDTSPSLSDRSHSWNIPLATMPQWRPSHATHWHCASPQMSTYWHISLSVWWISHSWNIPWATMPQWRPSHATHWHSAAPQISTYWHISLSIWLISLAAMYRRSNAILMTHGMLPINEVWRPTHMQATHSPCAGSQMSALTHLPLHLVNLSWNLPWATMLHALLQYIPSQMTLVASMMAVWLSCHPCWLCRLYTQAHSTGKHWTVWIIQPAHHM